MALTETVKQTGWFSYISMVWRPFTTKPPLPSPSLKVVIMFRKLLVSYYMKCKKWMPSPHHTGLLLTSAMCVLQRWSYFTLSAWLLTAVVVRPCSIKICSSQYYIILELSSADNIPLRCVEDGQTRPRGISWSPQPTGKLLQNYPSSFLLELWTRGTFGHS